MLESYYNSWPESIICGSTMSEITNEYTYGGKTKKEKNIIPDGSLQPCFLLNGNFVLISHRIFMEIGMIDSFF